VFRFQYEYEFEDFLILNRVGAKAYRRRSTLLVNMFCLLMGGGHLLAAGVLTCLKGKEAFPTTPFNLISSVLLCALPFLRYHIAAWKSLRMQMKDTGELTVVLDEDGLREHSLKGEGFHPWQSFIAVYRSRGSYLLFADKKHASILPRRVITEETIAPLERFLTEKIGTEIKEIH